MPPFISKTIKRAGARARGSIRKALTPPVSRADSRLSRAPVRVEDMVSGGRLGAKVVEGAQKLRDTREAAARAAKRAPTGADRPVGSSRAGVMSGAHPSRYGGKTRRGTDR